jgi:hypothetical protein
MSEILKLEELSIILSSGDKMSVEPDIDTTKSKIEAAT